MLALLSGAAALAACPAKQGYPIGETKATATGFDASGKKRTYHVNVPSTYDNTKPTPLLFAWSGLNAPCLNIYNNIKKQVAARGYILVSPCASLGDGSGIGGIGFNAGVCCGFKKNDTTDDFAFARTVLADLREKLCIDDDLVFSSGFSNGAFMSEDLACLMPGDFKAVASVSGVVALRPGNAGALSACDAAVRAAGTAKRTAVLNVHGTLDPMVPMIGDPVVGFPAIPKDMAAWAARSGCAGDGKQTLSKGKFTNLLWDSCTSGAQVELVKNAGGTHAWPVTSDFDTTEYMLDFFARFGAPAGARLASWESHGELMDEAALAQPVLSDDLIAAVNRDPASTWVAGRNARFEGMTLKQAKALMGTKQSTDRSTWLPHKPVAAAEIPDEFDWRTDARAAKCPSIKEIRDQANCGSCWAFGSVEAMTDRICLASKGEQNVHLSAQDMMSCNKAGDMGCSGGVPSTCYTYWKSNGVVSGGNYGDKSGCWSYQIEPCAHHTNSTKYPSCDSTPTGKAGSCAKQCKDNTALDWKTDKHHGKDGGYSVCQQGSGTKCKDAMAQEIYQNGPITAQFFVHQSFESYKSGVYQHTGMADPMLGGHAIKIVGYGNENDVPYWLVANSWNEDWGMGGFFKIVRGKNEGQIEDPIINGGPVAGEPQL